MSGRTLRETLQRLLATRDKQGELRRLRPTSRLFGAPERFVDFFSNDYLGFARSRTLHQAIMADCAQIPPPYNGATGSRLLSGALEGIEQLEHQLAEFFGAPETLVFSSGYQANLSVFSAIPQRGDVVWYDAHIHASVKDGIRLGYAEHHAFQHNDVNHLADKLKWGAKKGKKKQHVAVEAVYSMYGDLCPLEDIRTVCAQYDAQVILDEAHSTGVLGKEGKGMGHAHNTNRRPLIRVHTFGKALGVQGACVAADEVVKAYLVNYARPFIYSTAPSPYLVASIRCALRHLRGCPQAVEALRVNVLSFGELIKELPQDCYVPSTTPIQSLILPTREGCQKMGQKLLQKGFCVWPILSPTVRRGQEHLRVCVHAFNTKDEMKNLLKDFKNARREAIC